MTTPSNLEAERSVLAAVMADRAALDAVADMLTAADFYSDAHARIYRAAVALAARGEPADAVTLAGELRGTVGGVEAVGGLTYLSRLIDATPAVAHVEAHASIVHEHARVRSLLGQCDATRAEVATGDYVAADVLRAHVDAVQDLAAERGSREASLFFDLCGAVVARYDAGTDGGLPTGLVALDALTGGMHAGDLIVVAARPGMGKSGLATTIARHVAGTESDGKANGVYLASLEMPEVQLAARLVCAEAGLSIAQYRKRALTPEQRDQFFAAANALSRLALWIDDTPAVTVSTLRARVRRHVHRLTSARLALIVVDYLQLMSGHAESREQEIAGITRGLKALAKDLEVPIVALAQLNRGVETRSTKDKRPQLSDLRESGAIEQDADEVHFIYRSDYYATPEQRRTADGQALRDVAEIIVAKQRNGPTDTALVRFIADSASFTDADDTPHASGCRCRRCRS